MMFESLRRLSSELQAGLVNISGLRRIALGPPVSERQLGRLLERFPDWPDVLLDLLSCFDGVGFVPGFGRFFSVAETLAFYDRLAEAEHEDVAEVLAVFGRSPGGALWALDLADAPHPGAEPVLAVPEATLRPEGVFYPSFRDAAIPPTAFQCGTAFHSWLEQFLDKIRGSSYLFDPPETMF